MLLSCYIVAYLATLFAKPSPDKYDFKHLPEGLSCRVMAVSKFAITVVCIRNANGHKTNEVLTFPFHYRLACGSFNQLQDFEGRCYGRDDLLAGDRIELFHKVVENNIDFCIALCIKERPGGVIPPSRRYRVDDFQPYHELKNAHLAERYDKIPLPRHLGVYASP